MFRLRPALIALAILNLLAFTQAPAVKLFVFEQPFWLNLHHFLYVLGRAEAKMPDAARRAVAGAPADQATGLASLAPNERSAWQQAVSEYARGLSKRDAVFDAAMIDVTRAVAEARHATSLKTVRLDAATAATLESVAPIYRRVWWPAHRQANDARIDDLQDMLARHGEKVMSFMTRAYQVRWPDAGFPVNIAAYSNWSGAYSTRGNLIVFASTDSGSAGASGLETIFHEAMHQWDDAMEARLRKAAARRGVANVPELLTHAMIFFTAGEAVRSVIPGHVPYAEQNGLWRTGRLGALKPALDAAWGPYLRGDVTLDAALDDLVRRSGGGRRGTIQGS